MEGGSKRKRKLSTRDDDSFSPKSESTTRPRRRNAAPDISYSVGEGEDVDIDGDATSEQSSGKAVKPTKGKGKSLLGDSQPAKKKSRKLVIESDEDMDDYLADEAVPEEPEENDDDYRNSSEAEEKPKASKGKAKAATATRGTKRKARGAPAASRSVVEGKMSIEPSASKKRVKLTLKVEDSHVDGDAASSTPDTSEKTSPATFKHDSPAPQVKKVKLPPIKKTKLPVGTTVGSATPTTATTTTVAAAATSATVTPAAPKPKLPLDIVVGSKVADIRKSQIATSDLDLSNKSVYQELFKTGSDGGAPRTGLNRRTKEEERRKELNKLKEEYFAKRAVEEAHSFDLQAQQDKIARFEQKLRDHRSAALYPNFIAAKWKELYDRDKRRQRDSESRCNGREEGEVK